MPDLRPTPDEFPSSYAGYQYADYVSQVPDGGILTQLAPQLEASLALLRPLSEDQAGYRYAAGKWSVKQLVGHLSDTERAFADRALHFARGNTQPVPGFDQDEYVAAAGSDQRPLPALLAEWEAVRRSTGALFRNLPREAWNRSGSADGVRFTVRAIAYIIAGHELHHRRVLIERYLD